MGWDDRCSRPGHRTSGKATTALSRLITSSWEVDIGDHHPVQPMLKLPVMPAGPGSARRKLRPELPGRGVDLGARRQ